MIATITKGKKIAVIDYKDENVLRETFKEKWNKLDDVSKHIIKGIAGTVGLLVYVKDLVIEERNGVCHLNQEILNKIALSSQGCAMGQSLLYGRTHHKVSCESAPSSSRQSLLYGRTHAYVHNKYIGANRSQRADGTYFENDMAKRIERQKGLEICFRVGDKDFEWSKIPISKSMLTFERLSTLNRLWYASQIGEKKDYNSDEQKGISYLYELITENMDWYLQHNTKVPGLLLKKGCLLSNTQLGKLGIAFNNSSGDLSETRVQNRDFVMFSLTTDRLIRESRYGHGVIFIKLDRHSAVLDESEGGWISLFEQGVPWDDSIQVRYKDLRVGSKRFTEGKLYRSGTGSMKTKNITYCYYRNEIPSLKSGWILHNTETLTRSFDCLSWIQSNADKKEREVRDKWFCSTYSGKINKAVPPSFRKEPTDPWKFFDLNVGNPKPSHVVQIPSMMQVFNGPDALSGIALVTIFNIIHMGGELRKYFLTCTNTKDIKYKKNLKSLLRNMFRIEVKVPVRYVIPPGSSWWAYFVGNMEDGDHKNVRLVVKSDHSKGIVLDDNIGHKSGELQIPNYSVTESIDKSTGKYIQKK